MRFFPQVIVATGLLGLAGPLLVPGFNLLELALTGSTDDYTEFCMPSDAPTFVLGEAKDCQLDPAHLATWALLAYVVASVLLMPVAVLVVGAIAVVRSRLRAPARSG